MRIRSKEEIKEIDLVLLNFAFKIVKQRVWPQGNLSYLFLGELKLS